MNEKNGIFEKEVITLSVMKYIIIISLILSAQCHAQTFAELQVDFEEERIEAFNYQLSRIEIYSFKNRRDSTLSSYKRFDERGNVVTARQYDYKSRKFYTEQFYEYDTLGRRIMLIKKSTFLDKLNKARVSTHQKYEYRGDSLVKIIIESYKEDELLKTKEFPERKEESIKYEKQEFDSLKRVVYFEYYSVAGHEKHEVKYHDNGKIQSKICYVDDQLWYIVEYNILGNVIEYKEWLYDSKSHKMLEHSLTYYNAAQKVIRIEYLNSNGRVKTTEKYYY